MNKTHETFVSNGIDDTLVWCVDMHNNLFMYNKTKHSLSISLSLPSLWLPRLSLSLFTSLSPTSINLSVLLKKKNLTENFGAKILILILKNHHFGNEWNLWFKTKTSCVREFSSYLVPSLGQSLSKLVGIKEKGQLKNSCNTKSGR